MTNLNTSTEATITDEAAIGFIPCYRLPFLSLFHADCMEIMKQYPDKYFDLAIVDPPYGIGYSGRDEKKTIKYDNKKKWDNETPKQEYFDELFRISKNQIIWGANYFTKFFELGKGIICWFKHQNGNFSQWEMAYTSIGNAKHFDRSYQQDQYNKIHPTQKPIQLYEFLIKEYSKPNFKILDTHFGSGSIALAVDKANRLDKMNLHLTACEIDKEYIDKAIKRISESIKQGTLSF